MSRPSSASILVATLLLAACQPPQIPITGGEFPQRGAARKALDALADALREPEVLDRIARVRIADLGLERAGRYHTVSTVIDVSDRLDPDDVGVVVRHEVCHALDRGHHLTDLTQAPDRPEVDQPRYTETQRRAEVFAQLCGLGPEGLVQLIDHAGPCAPPWVVRLAEVVLEAVYLPPERPPVVRADREHLDAAPWDPAVTLAPHLGGRLPSVGWRGDHTLTLVHALLGEDGPSGSLVQFRLDPRRRTWLGPNEGLTLPSSETHWVDDWEVDPDDNLGWNARRRNLYERDGAAVIERVLELPFMEDVRTLTVEGETTTALCPREPFELVVGEDAWVVQQTDETWVFSDLTGALDEAFGTGWRGDPAFLER